MALMGSVPQVVGRQHQRSSGVADDIDFEIKGGEMQFVEIELDPGESAIAEAGAMMFKNADITMDTVFGDGSHSGGSGGFLGKLAGAGKRLLTGEGLFTTLFLHEGHGKARVAFAAPYPGHILPIRLDQMGGTLVCQKDSFLCAARGVSLGIYFQQRVMTGLFGGEGFVMQRLDNKSFRCLLLPFDTFTYPRGSTETSVVDAFLPFSKARLMPVSDQWWSVHVIETQEPWFLLMRTPAEPQNENGNEEKHQSAVCRWDQI